jgi:hypothetical protein
MKPRMGGSPADNSPISCMRRHASITQSGLDFQASSHQDHSRCPPCYTQLTIVTCCCYLNQCIVNEETKSSSFPSHPICQSEDTAQSQKIHRNSDCQVLGVAPSSTGEIVFPSWPSTLHICADTGTCKRRCCARSHLGKRIIMAARRTLGRFGFKQKLSAHFQSESLSSTDYRGQSSTEDLPMLDSTSRTELEVTGDQRYLVCEAGSVMRLELPTREIDQALQELPADLPSEVCVPDELLLSSGSAVSAVALSPHFAFTRDPSLCRPMLQPSKSTLETCFRGAHCPASPNESLDLSDGITKKNSQDLENGHDHADHIRSLSDDAEQETASEVAADDRTFPTRNIISSAGRYEFYESPTSICSETEVKNHGQNIINGAATIGAFAESCVTAGRQASCTSNGYNTPNTPVDLYTHTLSYPETMKLQPPSCQLCNTSKRYNVPLASSSCDGSASVCNSLCLQRLTLLRGTPSELLGMLNSQFCNRKGLMPIDLHERIEGVLESTTEQSLRKLDEVKDPELRVVVEPIYRIKPTLEEGLSALNSLYIGQVPNRLNGVVSLLFIACSIVTIFVDEQSQPLFNEALFLDNIGWMNAIDSREERDAFEMLLQYVWLPAPIGSVCAYGHRPSSCEWISFRPTRTPIERTSKPFEEGLGAETEIGFRLRTGLNAQICQWCTDCENRL